MPPISLIRVFALMVVMILAACPGRTRRTLVPKVPTHGDAAARTRFERAQSQFRRDGDSDPSEFAAIAEEYPDDPIAPYALLYAGIAALRSGDHAGAVASLEKLDGEPGTDAGLRARGDLYLGIAYAYQGEYGEALPRLEGVEAAIADDYERGEWIAALAEASGRGQSPLRALAYYDRWYGIASASERAYIVSRLEAIVAAAAEPAARQAYAAHKDRKRPSAAILGARVAADYISAGANDRAEKIRRETADARRALGMISSAPPGARGDPRRLGAVLPLSGRRARVGDSVVRGLAVATRALGGEEASSLAPLDLSIRDSASTSAGALAAVDALAGEQVIAIVGPIDGGSVDAVARRAALLGLPQLSLNPRAAKLAAESPFVFHIMHSAEDRARALASYAYENGVRDFAILGPDSGYGHAIGQAFREQVVRLGGSVVVEHYYDGKTTSFAKVVAKVRKPWQAIFVPEVAKRLELIAPALAAANLIATPLTGKKPRHGRKILLLSTAEGLGPKYLRSSGRYSHGAILAPGFYPDRLDPVIADFVDRYEEVYARLPGAIDAYAHDAVTTVDATVTAGATSRAEVSAALAQGSFVGLTGTIAFGPHHRRRDRGLLYRVDRGAQAGELVIRALRD